MYQQQQQQPGWLRTKRTVILFQSLEVVVISAKAFFAATKSWLPPEGSQKL